MLRLVVANSLFAAFFSFSIHFGELVLRYFLRDEAELVLCSSLAGGVERLRVEELFLGGVRDLAKRIFFVQIAVNFLKAV